MGFDAVQISPAQKSKSGLSVLRNRSFSSVFLLSKSTFGRFLGRFNKGHEWWTRYQPLDYCELSGLGSFEELKELCRAASELQVTVIGDVVFNHMLVVAPCAEWRSAQADGQRLRELQERLVKQTGMQLEEG